ncbi:hypothetical protein QTP88_017927 [Uroleucon formosanum]
MKHLSLGPECKPIPGEKAVWFEVILLRQYLFTLEFEPVAYKELLRTLIDKKIQLEDESITYYLNEVESLCKRIDKDMKEEELVYHMLKRLGPEIIRYISILDNNC